jgi:hypothetical protein
VSYYVTAHSNAFTASKRIIHIYFCLYNADHVVITVTDKYNSKQIPQSATVAKGNKRIKPLYVIPTELEAKKAISLDLDCRAIFSIYQSFSCLSNVKRKQNKNTGARHKEDIG